VLSSSRICPRIAFATSVAVGRPVLLVVTSNKPHPAKELDQVRMPPKISRTEADTAR